MLVKALLLSALTLQLASAAPKCRPKHTTSGPVETGTSSIANPTSTSASPGGSSSSSSSSLSLSSSSFGSSSVTTTSPTSGITEAPGLSCTGGSTVLTTTECTRGNTISYCYSPPAPIQCGPGYFPSVYHPVRCVEAQTCFPIDADYITTTCSPGGGLTPYRTTTLYQGTLADGKSTIISIVQCGCNDGFYYSYPSSGSGGPYCIPRTNCPAGLTTSLSTNEYCLTATQTSVDNYCTTDPITYPFCACPTGTPVYASGGSTPTGCA